VSVMCLLSTETSLGLQTGFGPWVRLKKKYFLIDINFLFFFQRADPQKKCLQTKRNFGSNSRQITDTYLLWCSDK